MTRPTHAGVPTSDDDATIARALEDVSVPALLCSLVHFTGDASILDGDLRPAGVYLNEVQGFMTPEYQAAARALALERIIEWRDAGCPLPAEPSAETIHRMMSFIVAEDVPAEYVPMMRSELGLDGDDPTDLGWADRFAAARRSTGASTGHVVVIGAGMSGILAGIRLADAGIDFTIIDKNDGLGGTWWENRYPGARVDVGNHFYCYSFEPNLEWTQFFAEAPELGDYFARCAERHGIVEHIRTGTEVTAARFDEELGTWQVELRAAATDPDGRGGPTTAHDGTPLGTPDPGAGSSPADGLPLPASPAARTDATGSPSSPDVETVTATAIISAVGQLNRPKLPDIPGIDSFDGPSMHSSRWDSSTDLTGQGVIVVGTGASAFQIVPSIAEAADHVTVFQRSAPWMFENPNYHEPVGDGVRWALEHLPYYGRWYRFLLFWPGCDGGLEPMRIDPDWPHQDRAVSEINDLARQFFTDYIVGQCDGDEDLAAKVTPDYVCLGKRTLQDNGSWLASLRRDDVELVTEPIAEVTPEGIIDATGRLHEADVIVWATGFHANRYLWPMEIVGREGVPLSMHWGDDPRAHLGITVPGYPNLFCMYGPGTNLAHGGSLIFHSECQIRYIMGCLAELAERGAATCEIRQDVADDYDDRLQDELSRMIWSHPSIAHSWYRNESGTIRILSPWRLVDYWNWTLRPSPDDFIWR